MEMKSTGRSSLSSEDRALHGDENVSCIPFPFLMVHGFHPAVTVIGMLVVGPILV